MSGLLNLRSIFQEDIEQNVATFQSNQPQGSNDTNFNYNENSFINQSFTQYGHSSAIELNSPILDVLLRGNVYSATTPPSLIENKLFVNNLNDNIDNHPFRVETFDPRPLKNALMKPFLNTEMTLGSTQYGPGGFLQNTTFPTKITDFSTAVGNNDSSFSPLSSLGVSFFNGENSDENLSWENLYNSNHTPKNTPTWEAAGLNAVNYGPNVNRENLQIGFNKTIYGQKSGFVGSLSRGTEPYIISKIGEGGREINRGGRFSPLTRALVDGERLSSFILSDEGLSFTARQNINIPISNTVVIGTSPLSILSDEAPLVRVPQRFGVGYNPLSTIGAAGGRVLGAGVPNIKIRKSFGTQLVTEGIGAAARLARGAGSDFSLKDEYTPVFNLHSTFLGDAQPDLNLILQNENVGRAAAAATTLRRGLGKFLSDSEGQRNKPGDKMTLAPMIKINKFSDETNEPGFREFTTITQDDFEKAIGLDINDEKNGLPFYFLDTRDDAYIFFRAYIDGLTENISPSYASHNYIGRSEPVYVYERGEREISFTLKLFANTQAELVSIYDKMDKLTSLCYPKYVRDGYGDNRMQQPLTKLRYGNYFGNRRKELMGYIKSLSYSVDQSSPYDSFFFTPKGINATIGYQVIHDVTPSIDTKFYGLNSQDRVAGYSSRD